MIVFVSQTKLPDSSNPLSDIVGAVQKRACILIKDITNDSNIIALNDKYKNSKFIPITDKHLKKIVDSIPSRISEHRNVDCSIDQYDNVACVDEYEPKEYSMYINQVAIRPLAKVAKGIKIRRRS